MALFAAGADAITLGNHAWDRREIIPYIAQEKRLIRPINYPPEPPAPVPPSSPCATAAKC